MLPAHAAKIGKDFTPDKNIELLELEDMLRKFAEKSKIGGTFLGKCLCFFIGTGKELKKSPQAAVMSAAMPFIIFVGVVSFGIYLFQREEKNDMKKFNKEILRDIEYRENMYFEAVEKILQKLKDPSIKSSLKRELEKQLNELDPDKKIRLFLQGKSPRPIIKSAPTSSTPSSTRFSTSQSKNIESATKKAVTRNPADEFSQTILQLEGGLRNHLTDSEIAKLRLYLQSRYDSISNEEKKKSALLKIKNRLGDNTYWIQLSKSLN